MTATCLRTPQTSPTWSPSTTGRWWSPWPGAWFPNRPKGSFWSTWWRRRWDCPGAHRARAERDTFVLDEHHPGIESRRLKLERVTAMKRLRPPIGGSDMTTLTLLGRRDPFAEFDALVRTAFAPRLVRINGFTPAADVTRDGDDALVRVELPGLDVERDVTVEVDRGTLVVRGERRDEKSEESGGGGLPGGGYGALLRAFSPPRPPPGGDP